MNRFVESDSAAHPSQEISHDLYIFDIGDVEESVLAWG